MTQAFNLALLANNVNSSGQLNADSGIYNTVNVANGGTNLSATPTNGQLLIGNGSGYTLATLTAGTGISISNAAGAITVTNSQPNATVDVQQFDAGGGTSWTKPTTGQTMCKIQVWGGGGGGSRSTGSSAAGGGGGGYNEVVLPLSYINSQTVTIGAAGVGRTGSNGVGTAGGVSSVTLASAWNGRTTVAAYGGGGGNTNAVGGTGGGPLSAGLQGGTGNSTASGSPYIHTYPYDICSGAFNVLGGQRGNTGLGGIWHGGAGSALGYPAGGSIYGGGGGSVGSSGILARGESAWGGNGGANAAGAVPGGGGGCSNLSGVNGSNGGAGRIIITCW